MIGYSFLNCHFYGIVSRVVNGAAGKTTRNGLFLGCQIYGGLGASVECHRLRVLFNTFRGPTSPEVSIDATATETVVFGNFPGDPAPAGMHYTHGGTSPAIFFGTPSVMVFSGGADAIRAGETRYLGAGFGSLEVTETYVQYPIVRDCNLWRLSVHLSDAPGVGESITVEVRINGVLAITLSLSGAEVFKTTIATTALNFVSAGSLISVKAVSSATAADSHLTVAVELMPDPCLNAGL